MAQTGQRAAGPGAFAVLAGTLAGSFFLPIVQRSSAQARTPSAAEPRAAAESNRIGRIRQLGWAAARRPGGSDFGFWIWDFGLDCGGAWSGVIGLGREMPQ